MQITEVSDALRLAPNSPIDCLVGIVEGVRDTKTGAGQRGRWTLQNITLRDRQSNDKIDVTFWNAPADYTMQDKGKTLTIQSAIEQFGKDGKMATEEQKYTPQKGPNAGIQVEKLVVTCQKSVITSFGDGAQMPPERSAPTSPPKHTPQPVKTPPAPAQTPRTTIQPATQTQGKTYEDAQAAAHQVANLLVMAKKGAKYVAEQTGDPYRPEDAGVIFIELARAGWVHSMPTGVSKPVVGADAREWGKQKSAPLPPPIDDSEPPPF